MLTSATQNGAIMSSVKNKMLK